MPSSLFPTVIRKRVLLSASIGNMLELYDFALYGYFAPIFAGLFFPSTDKTLSVAITFAVFAVGFIMRPLGAILFGYFGDRVGRKKALSVSILLMAIPTTLIGLLPTYAQIGIAAGVLLLCCRLLQGLATGGEFTGSIIYIAEHVPENRRGLYGGWAMSSTFTGFLIGSGISAIFTLIIPADALHAWGWRIPFLLGFILGIIGLYLRLRMPETPNFIAMQAAKQIATNPLSAAVKEGLKPMLFILGLNFLPAASYYMSFVYLSSYFVLYLKFPLHIALTVNTINMVLLVIIVPLLGFISDKIGRKPLLIIGCLGFVLLSYPLFSLMQSKTFVAILLAQFGFTVFVACLFAVIPATVVEMVKTKIRYTAISLPYNVSSALFGGIMPLVATFLIHQTTNLASPSFYLILAGIVTIFTVFCLRESFHSKLL